MNSPGQIIIQDKGYSDRIETLLKDSIIRIKSKGKDIYIGTVQDFLDDIDFTNIEKKIERRWG